MIKTIRRKQRKSREEEKRKSSRQKKKGKDRKRLKRKINQSIRKKMINNLRKKIKIRKTLLPIKMLCRANPCMKVKKTTNKMS